LRRIAADYGKLNKESITGFILSKPAISLLTQVRNMLKPLPCGQN